MRATAFIALLVVASPANATDIGIASVGTSRTLQVGGALQPGQRIVTGPNDRLDLLFVDGTSVTVAADSTLVIDRFDRGAATSELALSTPRGTFRIVSGGLDGDRIVHLVTPSVTVDLKNGIATVDITDRLVATFLQGDTMTVTGYGVSRTATRIGSQIASAGGPPGSPRVVWQGGVTGREKFEQAVGVDPPQRLFGISGTILRPRVSDVRAAADEAPTALTSNPDNSSSTPSGTVFKPPTMVAQPHSNPAHAAVTHHTTTTHAGTIKPK